MTKQKLQDVVVVSGDNGGPERAKAFWTRLKRVGIQAR